MCAFRLSNPHHAKARKYLGILVDDASSLDVDFAHVIRRREIEDTRQSVFRTVKHPKAGEVRLRSGNVYHLHVKGTTRQEGTSLQAKGLRSSGGR